MKKDFLPTCAGLCFFLVSQLSFSAWEGDLIGSDVLDSDLLPDATNSWDNPSATVSFTDIEFTRVLNNVTTTADFTENRLTLTYTNTSTFNNITYPPLVFDFFDLNLGGNGIQGISQVSSNFSQPIIASSTPVSIRLEVPGQNTNVGESFTAVFEFAPAPDVSVVTSDPVYSFDYGQIGTINTGFEVRNPQELTLEIVSSFEPDFGLQAGQKVQEGFVIYDGTLLLEVDSEALPARTGLTTTYRMNVDPRALGRAFLRARYLRQGVFDDELDPRAAAGRAARAARLSDIRIMRYVEDEGRWLRAARVSARANPRVDARFVRRAEPRGVIGEYGTFVNPDDTAYVWAVIDRNSSYTIGINSDDDGDGVFNVNDNCRNDANANQLNTDGDEFGNVCDDDDDGDGVDDDVDNCPLNANADQADTDGDGAGDVCDDDDDDGDGVPGDVDQCPATGPSEVVNADGCSVSDLCPCDTEWKNHGAFVKCTAQTSGDFLEAGLITEAEKDAIVSAAGGSSCGKKK